MGGGGGVVVGVDATSQDVPGYTGIDGKYDA